MSTITMTSTDLLQLAISGAAEHTRIVAQSIRRNDYQSFDRDGVPDHGQACWRLGCYLINDATDTNDLNDRQIANNFGQNVQARTAARQRNDQRAALALIITRLDDAAFRRLVDQLAGF